MSMRDEFEKHFPRPDGVFWDSHFGRYETNEMEFEPDADEYDLMWRVWQAARAQSGQGAEVVSYVCHNCGNEAPPPAPYKMYVKCPCGATTAATIAADLAKQAHPQPAVPEGYPDCDTCGGAMDYMPWHYATETDRHLHACNECWPKVNPATPQADGWVLVPADHLPEVMEKAAVAAAREYTARTGGNCMKTIYKALVNAAPQPPAGQEGAQ